jgi:hypothetical protein
MSMSQALGSCWTCSPLPGHMCICGSNCNALLVKKDYKLPAAAANTERRSRRFWSGKMCKSNYARASGAPHPRLTVT